MATISPGSPECHTPASIIGFVVASAIIFTTITTLVALRLYTRFRVVHAFWWDDVFLIVAYCLYLPNSIMNWMLVHLGVGEPFTCLSASAGREYVDLQRVATFIEVVCVMFPRTSAAIFVVRIFGIAHWLKIFLSTWTVFMAVTTITTAIIILVGSLPSEDDNSPALGFNTERTRVTFLINGIISIISDFILTFLPIYFLYNLQLKQKAKIFLIGMFAILLIPASLAIGRTIVSSGPVVKNPQVNSILLFYFGNFEFAFLIICTTIPAVTPLFSKGRRKSTSRRTPASYFRDEQGRWHISKRLKSIDEMQVTDATLFMDDEVEGGGVGLARIGTGTGGVGDVGDHKFGSSGGPSSASDVEAVSDLAGAKDRGGARGEGDWHGPGMGGVS